MSPLTYRCYCINVKASSYLGIGYLIDKSRVEGISSVSCFGYFLLLLLGE